MLQRFRPITERVPPMAISSTFPRQLTDRASRVGVTLVKCPPKLVREFRTRGYGAELRRPTVHTHLYWRGDLTAGQRAHHVTFLLDLLEQQPKTRELLEDPDIVIPSPIRVGGTKDVHVPPSCGQGDLRQAGPQSRPGRSSVLAGAMHGQLGVE